MEEERIIKDNTPEEVPENEQTNKKHLIIALIIVVGIGIIAVVSIAIWNHFQNEKDGTNQFYRELKEIDDDIESIENGTNEEEVVVNTPEDAYEKAKIYLDLNYFDGFSKKALIEQLTDSEGYSMEVVTDAINRIEKNGEVNWNEQATKAAERTLSNNKMSREDLIEYLTFEGILGGYTRAQAEYAADQVGLTE